MTKRSMHRSEKLTCIRCLKKFQPRDENSPVFLCDLCREEVRETVRALVRNEIRHYRKVPGLGVKV